MKKGALPGPSVSKTSPARGALWNGKESFEEQKYPRHSLVKVKMPLLYHVMSKMDNEPQRVSAFLAFIRGTNSMVY